METTIETGRATLTRAKEPILTEESTPLDANNHGKHVETVSDASPQVSISSHPKINLGLGLVFSSSDEVLDYIRQHESEDSLLPRSYKNRLSKMFLSGTLEGQVYALFRDFRKYGEQVHPKIKDFFTLLKTGEGEISTKNGIVQVGLNLPNPTKRLLTNLALKINPSDPSMLLVGSNRLDVTYLKLWLLEELIPELGSIPESTPEQ